MLIPCENKTVVIFDFDMTLVDTSIGSALAYKSAISAAGGCFYDFDLFSLMSEFLDCTYDRILMPTISFDEFCRIFYDVSHQNMAAMSQFSPRIFDLLSSLIACNKRLAIVTNKDALAVSLIMKQHDLDQAIFDCIITCDDVHYFKPNPEGLLLCIERLGAKKRDCLYVGDNINDLVFADNAGIDGFILSGIYPIKKGE